MTSLSSEEIQEIDKCIDERILSLALLSFPHDIALIHLLRSYEDWNRIIIPKETDSAERNAMHKCGQDGIHFAILWVYRFCPRTNSKPALAYQEKLYSDAYELFSAAMDYSSIWSFMSLIQRGKATAYSNSDNSVSTNFCNLHDPYIDIADTIIGGPDDPETLAIANEQTNLDVKSIIQGLKIRQVSKNKIKYSIPSQIYTEVSNETRKLCSPRWELEPSWDIGGYTLSDFKEIWISLLSISMINHFACSFSGIEGLAIDSVVMVKNRSRWLKELARYSNISLEKVELILKDLTYEHKLYIPGAKQPDATYQPFFPVGEELLCLSNWLVILSNAERNIWDLIDIKRPKLHSTLRNLKEQKWIAELKPKLQSYNLDIFSLFDITINGVESEIDLLVVDCTKKFGIAFQLKWLTAPDSIKDVFNKDIEFREGIRQAKITQEWLDSVPAQLSQIIGISEKDLRDYQFKTMILSHNTLGSGWLDREGIPIINERILHWVLGTPHYKDLISLWKVALNKTYMPKQGMHYSEGETKAQFFEFRFAGKGFKSSNTWTPVKDIHF
jgi:hypothetical protein